MSSQSQSIQWLGHGTQIHSIMATVVNVYMFSDWLLNVLFFRQPALGWHMSRLCLNDTDQDHLVSNWWTVYLAFLALAFWRLAYLPSWGWVFSGLGCSIQFNCWKRPIHTFLCWCQFFIHFLCCQVCRGIHQSPNMSTRFPTPKTRTFKTENKTHTYNVCL